MISIGFKDYNMKVACIVRNTVKTVKTIKAKMLETKNHYEAVLG